MDQRKREHQLCTGLSPRLSMQHQPGHCTRAKAPEQKFVWQSVNKQVPRSPPPPRLSLLSLRPDIRLLLLQPHTVSSALWSPSLLARARSTGTMYRGPRIARKSELRGGALCPLIAFFPGASIELFRPPPRTPHCGGKNFCAQRALARAKMRAAFFFGKPNCSCAAAAKFSMTAAAFHLRLARFLRERHAFRFGIPAAARARGFRSAIIISGAESLYA